MNSKYPRRFRSLRRPHLATLGVTLLVAFGPPASVQAQSGAPPTPPQPFFDWTDLLFPAEEYAERRARLVDALDSSGGVLLVPSGHGLSYGETFRQQNDFLYLTGLELPGSVLALDAARGEPTLFVPQRDFRFFNPGRPNDFPGRELSTDPEVGRRSGIGDVRPFGELHEAILAWQAEDVTVHVNAGRPGLLTPVRTSLIPDWNPAQLSLQHLQTVYPELELRNAYEAMGRVRMIKTPAEIDAIRRSAEATMRSIRTAARTVREGVTERDLEAEFEGACKRDGAQRIGFASIIKSGPNSLWPWRILASHYDRRNRAMRDGDLVIFDVGCEVDFYISDVGRTFPVSGRFSEAQREVLEMEVGVADAIIDNVRPGITFRELQAIANDAIPPEHRQFMQTGLFFGHHIGLSTGDPNLPNAPLEPGMVFTVEPWYYNHQTGISVFTEDEILVTEDGAEILTSALPRTAEGLERLMAGGS